MDRNHVGKQCFSSHSPGSYSRFLLIIISKELSSPKNPKVMISVSIFVISSYLSTQVHCLKYLDAKLSASQCVPMWGTYLLHIFINLPSPPPCLLYYKPPIYRISARPSYPRYPYPRICATSQRKTPTVPRSYYRSFFKVGDIFICVLFSFVRYVSGDLDLDSC